MNEENPIHKNSGASITFSYVTEKILRVKKGAFFTNQFPEIGTKAAQASEEASKQLIDKLDYEGSEFTDYSWVDIHLPIYGILKEVLFWKNIAEELYVEARRNQDKVEELELDLADLRARTRTRAVWLK